MGAIDVGEKASIGEVGLAKSRPTVVDISILFDRPPPAKIWYGRRSECEGRRDLGETMEIGECAGGIDKGS